VPLKALILVAVAALAHATWNFLAKKSSHLKHLIFLSAAAEILLFAPAALYITATTLPTLNHKTTLFLLATGILHVLYTESLLRGYRAGDLTVIYPLTRGIAPLLSFAGAILLLHEHASPLSIAGALLISAGILIASGGLAAILHSSNRTGLLWAAATGIIIACYTLTDAYSVKILLISPLLVEYAGTLFRLIVLTPGAVRQHQVLRKEFKQCWREALTIGLLFPSAYILVLFAMRYAPVSHVAPAREMSMLIGIYLGARYLNEGHLTRRILGSALILAGVAALALG
jgi:uncharacterized membrane protein